MLVFGAEHILNTETAGHWTFLIYPKRIPGEDGGSVSLNSPWALQVYCCSIALAPSVISVHAQSRKVQNNSLCVWMQLKTTYFPTFSELLLSFPFSTRCSRLWPKEADCRFCPSFCVMPTFHGKRTGLQLTPDATHPLGFVHFSNLSVEGPQHTWTNSPKCLSLVWESIVRVGGIACNLLCKRLQITPLNKSFTFGNLLKVPTTEARFFQLDGQYGISDEKEEEAGFAKRRADYSSWGSPRVTWCSVAELLTALLWGCKLLWALVMYWCWWLCVSAPWGMCLARWPSLDVLHFSQHKPHFSPGPSHVSHCFQDWSCRHHPWMIHIPRGNCSH